MIPINSKVKETALSLYAEGISVEQIVKGLPISRGSLYRLLKEGNLPRQRQQKSAAFTKKAKDLKKQSLTFSEVAKELGVPTSQVWYHLQKGK